MDKQTGFVKPDRGVSVFDNPESVSATGRVPFKVNTKTVPDTLQIKQQGRPGHFEITPQPGANLTPEQFTEALECIQCIVPK